MFDKGFSVGISGPDLTSILTKKVIKEVTKDKTKKELKDIAVDTVLINQILDE